MGPGCHTNAAAVAVAPGPLPVSCPPLDQSLPVPIVWAGCRSTQYDEAERQLAGAAGIQCFRCAVTGRRNS